MSQIHSSPTDGFPSLAAAPVLAPAAADSYPGLWVYAPSSRPEDNASHLYVPEFIELRLRNRGSSIFGDYRARYHIPDRAISPDISFTFDGATGGTFSGVSWHAADGSVGTIDLTITGPRALQVNWRVTRFGAKFALGAGTAVLLRAE